VSHQIEVEQKLKNKNNIRTFHKVMAINNPKYDYDFRLRKFEEKNKPLFTSEKCACNP
jgi:hypothetical protein